MTRPTFARAFTGAGRWLLTGFAVLALAWAPTDLAGQTGQLVGTVRDASSGRPLEAAQVYIDATGIGALTNANGRYLLLNVPVGEVTLVAELVGYRGTRQTTTVTAGESTVVDFGLAQTAIALDEIVVTGTASRTRAREIGNSIGVLDADIAEVQPISNVSDLLRGRIAGVVVQQGSGDAGTASTIKIRGSSTMRLVNDGPLVYIDGVRVNNRMESGTRDVSRIDDLDPAMIESVEVIKGPSSTLYGGDAIAGLVNLVSKVPTAEPELSLLANATTAGGYDVGGFYTAKGKRIGLTLLATGNL
ncbi:MAG: TonB-dependent receptor, partial [Gemmatimonadetes bacterium]|nr:TonB-dependent receptor [Gemmatimonadota bacterium]